MEITDVPFAVLRFQYQLARFPLQLIEEQVVAGMSSEAPTRLFYERWLGGLDAAVGKMLGDPDLEKRGAALIERSDALRRAAQLHATATQNQQQADDDLKAKRDKAIEDQKDAPAVTEREVEERGRLPKSGRAPQRRLRRSVPPPRSSRPTNRRQPSLRIRPKRPSARSRPRFGRPSRKPPAAEPKLDDAQAKRSDAASKRAQADQVKELADVEKQNVNLSGANDA
jgi:hypothetical protein